MGGPGNALKELLPRIVERREEIERERRLPRDLAVSLRDTGIFALPVPRAIGGEEAPPTDMLRVIESVAEADGSAGWCAMIGISGTSASGYMNETGAKELFADPRQPVAGIAAPIGRAVRTDGGIRVTGRWGYASGITHCDTLWAGCMIFEGDQPVMTPHGPQIVHAFMPVAAGEVHDTWHVVGMSGTGSNDFSANDVFVPEHHVFSLFDPSGHRPEPLYRFPGPGLFASSVASVSLGIARAAIDALVEGAQSRVPSLSMGPVADKPHAQTGVARAEAALGAARSFLYDTVEDVWQTVSAGREASMRQRALLRSAATHAVETGAQVARSMALLGGGKAIYLDSPLQRFARDAEVICHHFIHSPQTWEEAGRVLLGREPSVPVF